MIYNRFFKNSIWVIALELHLFNLNSILNQSFFILKILFYHQIFNKKKVFTTFSFSVDYSLDKCWSLVNFYFILMKHCAVKILFFFLLLHFLKQKPEPESITASVGGQLNKKKKKMTRHFHEFTEPEFQNSYWCNTRKYYMLNIV